MTRKYERMTEINSQRSPSFDSYRNPKGEAHRTQLQFARAKAVDGTNYYYPIFSVDSLANKNQLTQEVLVSQI